MRSGADSRLYSQNEEANMTPGEASALLPTVEVERDDDYSVDLSVDGTNSPPRFKGGLGLGMKQ